MKEYIEITRELEVPQTTHVLVREELHSCVMNDAVYLKKLVDSIRDEEPAIGHRFFIIKKSDNPTVVSLPGYEGSQVV